MMKTGIFYTLLLVGWTLSLLARSSSPFCLPAGKITEYCDGYYLEIAPDAGPRVCCGCDATVTADFVYWTPIQEGLEYAASGWRSPTADQNPSKGQVKIPNFGYHPGFKVGIGFGFDHDGWDLSTKYTWYYTHHLTGSSWQEDVSSSTLHPLWYNPAALPPLDPYGPVLISAQSRWKIAFNVLDIDLGRNFFVSRALTLRPFCGVKSSLIWQTYNLRYRHLITEADLPRYRLKMEEKFWGVGLRSGLNSAWHFNRCFSLFGDLCFSTLWGEFDLFRKDTQVNSADPTDEPTRLLKLSNSFHTLKPTFECELGLRFETWAQNDEIHFSCEIGFEEQIWWEQNQFFRIFEESNLGNLTFQGINFKVRFDF